MPKPLVINIYEKLIFNHNRCWVSSYQSKSLPKSHTLYTPGKIDSWAKFLIIALYESKSTDGQIWEPQDDFLCKNAANLKSKLDSREIQKYLTEYDSTDQKENAVTTRSIRSNSATIKTAESLFNRIALTKSKAISSQPQEIDVIIHIYLFPN